MTSDSPAAGRKSPATPSSRAGRPRRRPEAGNLAVLLMTSRTTSDEATSKSNAL